MFSTQQEGNHTSEVGALVIRLQAETAQFSQDLGKVKSQLADLGDGGKKAGASMASGMYEARGSLMLVEESVGVRLPRHLNSLIATIPGVGEAFAVMLPLVGVVAAIAIITKLIEKHDEMKDKVAATRGAYVSFAAGAADSLRDLQSELLQAGMKMDALTGDHADALKKELQLIDNQTLTKLISEFDKLADHADKVFADMRAQESFFQIGSGAKEAQTALKEFKDSYDLAMSQGNTQGAAEALAKFKNQINGAVIAANKAKEALHGANEAAAAAGQVQLSEDDSAATKELAAAWKINADLVAYYGKEKAVVANISATDKDVANLHGMSEELKGNLIPFFGEWMQQQVKSGTYTSLAAKEYGERWEAALNKQSAEGAKAAQKLKHVYDDLTEEQIKKQQEVDAAAMKGQKDVAEQMRQVETTETEINLQNFKDMLAQMKTEQERFQADAEKNNTSLSGIGLDVAKVAEAKQQIALLGQEMARLGDEEKQLEADRALVNPSDIANVNKYTEAINQLKEKMGQLNLEQAKAQAEVVKLGTSWGDYFARMKGETVDLATTMRTNLQQSLTQFTTSFSNAMSKSIIEGKNFGQAMRQVAAQFLETMLSALIQWLTKWILTHTIASAFATTSAATSAAAQKAAAVSLAGANGVASYALAPWPIDLGAPAFGASMAAAATGFAEGGLVPGSGSGDTVPAFLTPGETVVTKALTDRVSRSEGQGGSSGDTHIHNHISATAMDAEGVDRVLTKHMTTLQRHVTAQIRRRNK